MVALTEAANAKVNLTLRVVGRRTDGFHDLESVVAFADCADRLTLTPGPELSLQMSGPLAQACGETSDNLVLKATRLLSERGHRVNVTLVFSAAQALLAAKAGAAFISPFVGRLDDIGHDGMELIGQILAMLDHYTYPAEVLVASVRSPVHVIKAAQMGAHVATCPFTVLQQLAKHPLTDIGLEKFLADWKKSKR